MRDHKIYPCSSLSKYTSAHPDYKYQLQSLAGADLRTTDLRPEHAKRMMFDLLKALETMHRFMKRPHGDIMDSNICAPRRQGGQFTLVDVLTKSKADFNFTNIRKDLLEAKDMPALCFNNAFTGIVGEMANYARQFERTNRRLYGIFWSKHPFTGGVSQKRIRMSTFSRTLNTLSKHPEFNGRLQQARELAQQIDEVNEISQDIAERVKALEGNVQNLLAAALNLVGSVRGATIASDVLAKYFP